MPYVERSSLCIASTLRHGSMCLNQTIIQYQKSPRIALKPPHRALKLLVRDSKSSVTRFPEYQQPPNPLQATPFGTYQSPTPMFCLYQALPLETNLQPAQHDGWMHGGKQAKSKAWRAVAPSSAHNTSISQTPLRRLDTFLLLVRHLLILRK